MADVPPVLKILDSQKNRYENLSRKFSERFGHPPDFFGRAPGRVNIIGEHIDYCGYAVLPMAIDQDVVIAVSHSPCFSKIILTNTNPQYRDYECDKCDLSLNKTDPEWFNYFLCGVHGVKDSQGSHDLDGMKCLVDGSVPPSSGLSSSSALVCCATLVTMHANKFSVSKMVMADLSADCENFIATSTEGGNMDQAIAFMAEEGLAQMIEFSPLRSVAVRLPRDVVFVITHSCTQIHKGATACFNVRVTECRMAAQVIAKKKDLDWRSIKTLRDVQEQLHLSLSETLSVAKDLLHKDAYTKEEVCEILGVNEAELSRTTLIAFTEAEKQFRLCDRAMHVFSEAERVYQFKRVCEGHDPDMLRRLGSLMVDSHTSCRDLFDCSCPELNLLVDTCLKSGALGSRLTGAGWGGCVVSMVAVSQVERFLQQVKDIYYANDPERLARVDQSVFITHPGRGAAIYTF